MLPKSFFNNVRKAPGVQKENVILQKCKEDLEYMKNVWPSSVVEQYRWMIAEIERLQH